jgi:hypothetical protein
MDTTCEANTKNCEDTSEIYNHTQRIALEVIV